MGFSNDIQKQAYEMARKPGVVDKEIEKMGINPNEDKLKVMMEMQTIFAERFHPVKNLSKEEIEHWVESYIDCIEDELAEVVEHVRWEKGIVKFGDTNNIKELKGEAIDILHFLMDEILVVDITPEELVKSFSEKYKVDLNGDTLSLMLKYEKEHHNSSQYSELSLTDKVMQVHSYFHQSIRFTKKHIDWKHWKKKKLVLDRASLVDMLLDQWMNLLSLFNVLEMNEKEIYETYTVKNVENGIRQRLGY